MSDCISREAALTELQNPELFNVSPRFLQILRDIPAADVAEVRHGRWFRDEDNWNSLTTFQCSVCGEEYCFECDEDILTLNYNYCPNCGAKMDLEGEIDDRKSETQID